MKPTAKDRVKASRLRARLDKGETLKATEADWLGRYEEEHPQAKANGEDRAAKRGTRVIVEEVAGARDDVDVPDDETKARTPSQIRAEGQRIDRLLDAFLAMAGQVTKASNVALEQMREVNTTLLERLKHSDSTYIEGLMALKDAIITASGAEAAVVAAENATQGGDPHTRKIVEDLLRKAGYLPEEEKANGAAAEGVG